VRSLIFLVVVVAMIVLLGLFGYNEHYVSQKMLAKLAELVRDGSHPGPLR